MFRSVKLIVAGHFLGGALDAHIHTGFIENICTFLAMRNQRSGLWREDKKRDSF